MALDDIISLTVAAFIAYPWIALLRTGDLLYLKWGLGMAVNELLNYVLKAMFGSFKAPAFKRPMGAANCDVFNRGGRSAGTHVEHGLLLRLVCIARQTRACGASTGHRGHRFGRDCDAGDGMGADAQKVSHPVSSRVRSARGLRRGGGCCGCI